MDPATFVVAEQAVSTTVEGAAIAGIGLAQSTQPLNATFTRITSEAFLPRSSHTISVVAGKAYIFGGEKSPGKISFQSLCHGCAFQGKARNNRLWNPRQDAGRQHPIEPLIEISDAWTST